MVNNSIKNEQYDSYSIKYLSIITKFTGKIKIVSDYID